MSRTLFAILVVSALSELITVYDRRYAWYYAIVVILGVMIFNAGAVSNFINFALSPGVTTARGRQSIKRPQKA